MPPLDDCRFHLGMRATDFFFLCVNLSSCMTRVITMKSMQESACIVAPEFNPKLMLLVFHHVNFIYCFILLVISLLSCREVGGFFCTALRNHVYTKILLSSQVSG